MQCRARHAIVTAALTALAVVLVPVAAPAASSSSVVSATVPSATQLDASGCPGTTPGITHFGNVTIGAAVVTTADCVVTFGSSNDSSMLLLVNGNGGGTAMTAAPASGVVGRWPLNGDLLDRSPTAAALQLPAVNPPTFVAAPTERGQALQFDGTNRAWVPANPALEQASYTIDLWMKTPPLPGSNWGLLASKTGAAGRNIQLNFAAGNTLEFSVDTTTAEWPRIFVDATPYTDNQWHHVAAVADSVAQRITLYVDAVQVGQASFTGTVTTGSSDLLVGGNGNAAWTFAGMIDELRIQSVPRTSAEIVSYYQGAVADYGGASWGSGANMFGACLRAHAGTGATPSWTPDATCAAADGAHWKGLAPSAGSLDAKVLGTSVPASTDLVARLRFGFRPSATQAPGTYAAPVTFLVAAPNL